MNYSWIVTLPPLFVIICAIVTHNIPLSLISGIVAACFIATGGHILSALKLMGSQLLASTSLPDFYYRTGSYDHAYVFGFLVCLGMIIALMQASGGVAAYARFIRSFIKTPRQAETMSLALSPFFFLDDYLNTLVNGSIMRPLFDKFSLAREKLAYILNSISSSQCLLIPASSWLAVILTELQASGVGHSITHQPLIALDPFTLYTATIPYILFPILSIASTWFIIRSGLSYGPMHTAEKRAQQSSHDTIHEKSSVSATAFFLPLGTLLLAVPISMLICAGWYPSHPTLSAFQALQSADVLLAALWWASLSAFIVTLIYYTFTRLMTSSSMLVACTEGALSMKGSIIMLTLAWTLSALLRYHVHTGNYLAEVLISSAPLSIIPLVCFIASTLVTASIGSSWAMMGIMIPLVIPLIVSLSPSSTGALADFPLLLPTLGALFSGAAAGPQISPIADAAIISSTVAGTTAIAHIKTLVPYCIPPMLSAAIGFLILARVQPHWYTILGVIAITIALMMLFHIAQSKMYKKQA
jgi:tetracycline resistance efflux pump